MGYTYDANGQVLSTTDQLEGVTKYTYDAAGRLLTATDPMGGVTAYTYDGMGSVLTITDQQVIGVNSHAALGIGDAGEVAVTIVLIAGDALLGIGGAGPPRPPTPGALPPSMSMTSWAGGPR